HGLLHMNVSTFIMAKRSDMKAIDIQALVMSSKRRLENNRMQWIAWDTRYIRFGKIFRFPWARPVLRGLSRAHYKASACSASHFSFRNVRKVIYEMTSGHKEIGYVLLFGGHNLFL